VYNIGGSSEKTNFETVQFILDVLGKRGSLIKHVEDRKGHDFRYAIDWTKINRTLGWSPTISFEDGMKRTIDWYIQHPEWIQTTLDEGDFL
jgi:dTDP-glucose 4,6-dehydratase